MCQVKSKSPVKASVKKSLFRMISEWLHLWLGLLSGIIVFVVCFTGGLWVFRHEVFYFTEKYQRVEDRQHAFLPPSKLISSSESYLKGRGENEAILRGITYGRGDKAANCIFELPEKKIASLFLDPYTGRILKDKRDRSATENFFVFVRAGHRFFWLPQQIGSPLVGTACIVFVITLITGLIWWYPKKWTKKTVEKSFKIKWSANWKRLNIDLHNVTGFYSLLFILILTVTGIVFTFDWFENGVYRALTWQAKEVSPRKLPSSDTTRTSAVLPASPEDVMWHAVLGKHARDYGRISINIPMNTHDSYQVLVTFGDGTLLYNRARYFYDRYTLKPLSHESKEEKPYHKLSIGEKVFRMNFDIHTGQILGLPTKIITFIACMIGAGLPVTGTIIWYNRKWGKRKKRRALS